MSTLDPQTIPRCMRYIDNAKAALFECRKSRSEETFPKHYEQFLFSTRHVWNALSVGSQFSHEGTVWYRDKIRLSRSDDMLDYMYNARNQQEHTLEDVSDPAKTTLQLGGPSILEEGEKGFGLNVDGFNLFQMSFGDPSLLPFYSQDRKRWFYPPKSHLGKNFGQSDAMYIAELYISFLEGLVSEASRLA